MIDWLYNKINSFIRFFVFILTLFLLTFGGLFVLIGQAILSVAEKTIIYSFKEK